MDTQKTQEKNEAETFGYVSLMSAEADQGGTVEPLLACYCNCGCACYVVPG